MALPPLLIDTPEVALAALASSRSPNLRPQRRPLAGGIEYEALNCAGGDLGTIIDACGPITKVAAANPLFGDYPPIFGYYLHECRAVGGWAESLHPGHARLRSPGADVPGRPLATQLVGSTAISSDCPEKALAEAEGTSTAPTPEMGSSTSAAPSPHRSAAACSGRATHRDAPRHARGHRRIRQPRARHWCRDDPA